MYSVADLMTQDVVTVDASEPLESAEALWQLHRCRHLPVVSGGRLVGIITPLDALAARANAPAGAELAVQAAMTKPVHRVGPRTPLRHAAEILLRRQIGCVVVTDDRGGIVGLLTEAELIGFALEIVTEMDLMSEGLRLDAGQDEVVAS
jgi:CBS domain-containing protein